MERDSIWTIYLSLWHYEGPSGWYGFTPPIKSLPLLQLTAEWACEEVVVYGACTALAFAHLLLEGMLMEWL